MPNQPEFNTDFLIVGQGLAGTLIAHFLLEAGQKIHVFDDNYPRAATKVAAGIINPVTGRRYVKSWRIDELIPRARATYRQLEKQLNIRIYHPRPVLRALFNNREVNDWQARAFDTAYRPYLVPREQVDIERYRQFTKPAFAYGELRESAQVEIGTLAKSYRQWLQQQGMLSTSNFDYSSIELTARGVSYGKFKARYLVFCEGAKARHNPFFADLPYEGNKGEALITEIADAGFQKILKHRIFIVPLADGRFWIGSTSDNFHSDDLPSEKGFEYLQEKVKNLLTTPFVIKEHCAAIRPTVKDRRPLIGTHFKHPQLVIFNGLGAKGASLGPYWAQHLVDALLNQKTLDPEVNIDRFKLKASK